MNFTECVNDDFDSMLYRGRMSIKERHTIANANESLYKYIGENSARPITSVIHPDDLSDFMDALDRLDEGRQHLFLRMLCFNKTYRMMYVIINYNGRVIDGFKSYDMECLEVVSSYERLVHDVQLVKKYRTIMSFSDKYYFDYSYETHLLTIFDYKFGHYNNMLYKKPLDELKKEVHLDSRFGRKQIAQFDIFCECLDKCSDEIDLELDGDMVGIPGKTLKFRGGTLLYDNEITFLVGVITPFNKEMALGEEKYYLSSAAIDRATGVFNKRAIEDIAKEALVESSGKPVYISILDIDEFKSFNDNYGHLMGDRIIENIAKIMKEVVGNRGQVGRFGGDEFVIVTKTILSDEDFLYIIKTIRKNIAWKFEDIVPGVKITLSIGIVKSPNDGNMYEELFEKADKCLYLAKQKGRNRYVLYSDDVQRYIKGEEGGIYSIQTRISDDKYKICLVIYDIIRKINEDGRDALNECFDRIKRCFDIDYIALYRREDLKIIASEGDPGDNSIYLPECTLREMAPFVDEYGVAELNKILGIKESSPVLYKHFEKNKTLGFLMNIGNDVILLFGITSKPRKWSDSDKGFLSMVSRAVFEKYDKTW